MENKPSSIIYKNVVKRLWLFIAVKYSNNEVYRLSHDLVTCDVNCEVSTAYCYSLEDEVAYASPYPCLIHC